MTAPPRFDRASRPLRTCAAVGCPRSVPGHLLMCMDHWRMVPAKLAREVTLCWRNRDRGNAQTLDYQAAVAAAVQAVAAKQLARGTLRVGGAEVCGDLFGTSAPDGLEQLSKKEQFNDHVSTSKTTTSSESSGRAAAGGGGEGDQCAGGLRGAG